ncbi:MAG: hypothetical protein ACTSV6_00740 [Candidatus Heimdallarchaeota archaeon]
MSQTTIKEENPYDGCSNQELLELLRDALTWVKTLDPSILALLISPEEAERLDAARKAAEVLWSREQQKIEAFSDLEFKYVEKIGDTYYVISIDCGATEATDIAQVRLERYSRFEDIENGWGDLIGIYESIDEAVMILQEFKKEAET